MKLVWLVIAGCSSGGHGVAPVAEPAATTECYGGQSTGMGQRAMTIVRRTVDPVAKQIVEDVSHDASGPHGAASYHVVMAVDGNHFTLTEASGAFTGNGTLIGEPWQWTSWTTITQIAKTDVTVESHDEVTSAGRTSTKQIKKAGAVIGNTTDKLESFDCSKWDETKSALTKPIADRASCERACRNFASLKYWQGADAEIAALPAADQAAARTRHEQDFASKIGGGLDTCASSCVSANNAEQTACLGKATTVDELAACDK